MIIASSEEEPKLLKMKEYDIAHDDVALKELTILTTNGAPGQVLASALIYLYNRLQDKQGEGGENETMKAHRGAREEKDQYAELNVGNKVSSVLFKRVDAMLKKIEKENDDVDAKIGEFLTDEIVKLGTGAEDSADNNTLQ